MLAMSGAVGRPSATRKGAIDPVGPIVGTTGRDTVQLFCRVGILRNSHMRLSDRPDSRSSTNDSAGLSGADTFIFTLYRFRQRRIELDTDAVLHPHRITEASDGICVNMIGMKVALL